MESEFNGQVMRAVERLAEEVEELGRRLKAFEALAERILAEQAELRRRQEAQSQAWQEFGRRWSDYSADWEVRLSLQTQQLEGFTKRLTDWEARLNAQLQVLDELTKQFTSLLPPEEY